MIQQLSIYIARRLQITVVEWHQLAWASLCFYSLQCACFMLRPVRDEMGIAYGVDKLQWLFTGTFLATLIFAGLLVYFGQHIVREKLTVLFYLTSAIVLGCFYLLFQLQAHAPGLIAAFFIWAGMFNLFMVSLFWSFLSRVFSADIFQQLFGVIAGAGSIGALTGPLIARVGITYFSFTCLLLISILLLIFSIFCIRKCNCFADIGRRGTDSQTKRPVSGSGKLKMKGITIFVLLYTAVSTLLYFQQAHIVEDVFATTEERIVYFAHIDLTVNVLSALMQMFFTYKIIEYVGMSLILTSLPIIIAAGLLLIGVQTGLWAVAATLVMHRVGNFSLLRPCREILFASCTAQNRYHSKIVIDTAVYRGGDAMSGWLFAGLLSSGVSTPIIALCVSPLALLWAFTGYTITKSH